MTWKTIIALFENEDIAPIVGDAATRLGAIHNGHVIGLHAEVIDPVPVYSPFDVPDPSLMTALYEAAAKRRQNLETIYNRTIGQSGNPNEWRVFRGTSGSTVTHMIETARSADLIVSGQPRPGFPSEFNDLLFESGRPVLFIPWVTRKLNDFARVLVAWDGSREAARAVFDALPFLKMAKQVEIFSVDPKDTGTHSAQMVGADLAAALDRHGVKAVVNAQSSGSISAAATIENRVTDFAADLLVMGAYSHSRIRETMFGGVTRTVLESMPVATFMSR